MTTFDYLSIALGFSFAMVFASAHIRTVKSAATYATLALLGSTAGTLVSKALIETLAQ